MREDIVGMLKNALEHGGNPSRVAQSLINSGYSLAEVQEALDFISKEQSEQESEPEQKSKSRHVPQIMPTLSQEPQEFEKREQFQQTEQTQAQTQQLTQIQKNQQNPKEELKQNPPPVVKKQEPLPQIKTPQYQQLNAPRPQLPIAPAYRPAQVQLQKLSPIKPLPVTKTVSTGRVKIILLFLLLFLLVFSLVGVIIFKDKVLELLG